jgi:hypothetical protein
VRLWQKTWKNSSERETPAAMRTTVVIDRKDEESSSLQ